MRDRKWLRGLITLGIVGALAGTMIASPVGAAFNPTKKKIKKIAKKQANKVFNSRIQGETVAQAQNADTLDSLDSRDLLPGRLAPSGTTVRGAYNMGDTGGAASALATAEISFGYRFAAAPAGHFINSGATPPAECPGTADDPEAAPGHLCIYEDGRVNVGLRGFGGPAGDGSTWPTGVYMFARSAATGDYYSFGTWAATAGSGPTPTRARSLPGTVNGS